jgi:hypothetical protein
LPIGRRAGHTALPGRCVRLEREAADVPDDDSEPAGGRTPEDPSRSGRDVREGVDRAAAGTPSEGVQTPPEDAKPHAAPVEQVRDDPGMTEGQVVEGA